MSQTFLTFFSSLKGAFPRFYTHTHTHLSLYFYTADFIIVALASTRDLKLVTGWRLEEAGAEEARSRQSQSELKVSSFVFLYYCFTPLLRLPLIIIYMTDKGLVIISSINLFDLTNTLTLNKILEKSFCHFAQSS